MNKKADLVLLSTAVFTAESDSYFAGGVSIKGDKILRVGTHEQLAQDIGSETQVEDFGDALILPGLCDAHGHYFMGAVMSSEKFCQTLDQARSEAECVEIMQAFVKEHPGLERYYGYGWMPNFWDNAPFPTKRSLDAVFPDVPVYLETADGHTLWCNTKALEESGYTSETTPLFGSIDRFPDGELTGLLREGGRFLADKYKRRLPEQDIARLNEELMHRLNAKGITAFSDLDATLPENMVQEYSHMKALEQRGACSIRLYLYPGTDIKADRLDEIDALAPNYQSDVLRIAGIKGFVDGVTSTYTAAMLEPYSDNPASSGAINKPEQDYVDYVLEGNRRGYSVRLHCIGDRAVRLALDIYEKSSKQNNMKAIRNAVEHDEVVHPADILRFRDIGAIASMQPAHIALEQGEKIYRTGERAKYEWPFQSLIKAGARVAIGTDFPIISFDPFFNIYVGVTRKDKDGTQYGLLSPDENMTVAQVLRGYTEAGAFINNMEDKTGTLTAGKYADIAVFSKNIFETAPEEILTTENLMTVMNGNIVFKK